jgi:hypothetical protein
MGRFIVRFASAIFGAIGALAIIIAMLSFSSTAHGDQPLTTEPVPCVCDPGGVSCEDEDGNMCNSNNGCFRCACCPDYSCANPCIL